MSEPQLEHALEAAQRCIETSPVIVLGSGASVAYGVPGMGPLRDHLLSLPDVKDRSRDELQKWEEFKAILKGTDLESALQQVNLHDRLIETIERETWCLLTPADLKVLNNVVVNRRFLALTTLLRHLFDSTHTSVSVVTTNYDRLAEYAADAGGAHHFTCFGYGHIRLRQPFNRPITLTQTGQRVRTVEIWKVHGSLDWFGDDDGNVVGLPVLSQIPESMSPVIVTPGIDKYRRTHDEPFRSILAGADDALSNARGYLCIGYGFNDAHIQPKLIERCKQEGVPLVILTRSLTPAAKEYLGSGKCPKYLVFEKCGDGTRICSSEIADGFEVRGKSLWVLDNFLAQTI